MKALKAKNIVHRDIKPGNILIKYHAVTGKMMVWYEWSYIINPLVTLFLA